MSHWRLVDWLALLLVATPLVALVLAAIRFGGRAPGLRAWTFGLGMKKGPGATFDSKVLRRWWPKEGAHWAETFGGNVWGFSVHLGVVQQRSWSEAGERKYVVGFCLSLRSALLAVRRFEAPGLEEGVWLTPVHPVEALPDPLRDLLEERGPWRWYANGRNTIYLAWVGPGEGPLRADRFRNEGLERALRVARHLCASRVLPAPGRKEFVQPRRPRALLGPAPEWVCPTCGQLLAAEARCGECEVDPVPVTHQRMKAPEANVISHNLRVLARDLEITAEQELLNLLQSHRIPAVCFTDPRAVCVFRRDLGAARRLRSSVGISPDGGPSREEQSGPS